MDSLIRLSVFVGILLVLMAWETIAPRRQLLHSRTSRWTNNIALSLITTLLLRFSIGGIAYSTALMATEMHYGVLNWLAMPSWLSILIALVLLDLAIFGQHVASHRWPLLWRLHKVHHTDQDLDVTSAVRFHPVEIILSLVYKVIVIGLLGAPAIAVLVFELILSTSALFNHSNIAIPAKWDLMLRWFVVTPDMHRIHHSTRQQETDSNFSSSISVWDRLFSTYTVQPELGQKKMCIGLSEYPDSDGVTLKKLLLMPFKAEK